MPQEAYQAEELDKSIDVGDEGEMRDEGEMISPFIDDRTIDPKVFLTHFIYTMMNQKCTLVNMCKNFPEYLIRSANEWFNELPKGAFSSS